MSKLPVITISRQSGSMGREAGRILAQQLGIPYYDYDILARAAQDSGLSPALFEQAETSAAQLLDRLEEGLPARNTPISVELFEAQSKIIRQMAEEGPCVIVGRCADTVLKGREDLVTVYIYASALFIRQIDRGRRAYHSFFSHHVWGDTSAYDLCICTDKLTPEETANVIKSYIFARD